MPLFGQKSLHLKAVLTFIIGVFVLIYTDNKLFQTSIPPIGRTLFPFKSGNGVQRTPQFRQRWIVPKGIQVPADMWRRPSEIESWNPVPLLSCCPDESRPASHYTYKFFCDCKREKDTVRYYGPGMEYTSDDLKNTLSATGSDLIMIGDSIAKQWYEALFCYLGGHQSSQTFNDQSLQSDITESFLRAKPSWRTNAVARSRLSDAFRFPIDKTDGATQNIQYLKMRWHIPQLVDIMDYYNTAYTHDFSRNRPIFVINLGLHYGRVSEWFTQEDVIGEKLYSSDDLEEHYKGIIRYCYKSGSKCIFRETSPTHFDTESGDGLSPGPTKAKKCVTAPPATFETLNRWRNDVLYDAIEEIHTMQPNIISAEGYLKVMPIFDKVSGLYSHRSAADMGELGRVTSDDDCTHYRMEAYIWEPWHMGLTEILSKND